MEYAVATFFSKVHVAHIFPHKLAFSTAILILFCLYYIFLLCFVTTTIWLPTEWHHPCVRTPVEQDGGTSAYLVFMQSAYFFKNATKLICLGDAHATTYIPESVLVRIPLMHCASLLSVMWPEVINTRQSRQKKLIHSSENAIVEIIVL